MSSETVIEVRNFSFAIKEAEILHDLSFTVHRNEYFSVLGPNGAGKTTLLKCLSRLHTGGNGTMKILGDSVTDLHRAELARRIGYVPQAHERRVPYSVEEFVRLSRYPYREPAGSAEEKEPVERALRVTGTEPFRSRRMTTLSGGENQKVHLAAAIAQDPEILLLDEPTTFLDPGRERDVLELLLRIKRDFQVTVVAVTHDINTGALPGDRIMALRNGRKAYLGEIEPFLNEEILEEVYDRSFQITHHPETDRRMVVPPSLKPA